MPYNANMKVNSSIVASFVIGAVVASLPYTLSGRKTLAQGAGPNQGQGQGFPPQQGGPQGFPGQGQGQFGQGQGFGQGQQRIGAAPMVNVMTTSESWLFASAGDTIYKIEISSMKIVGQTKLPQPRPENQGNPGIGRNPGGSGRPRNGGGSIPPSEK
jgi:hypothetical protein